MKFSKEQISTEVQMLQNNQQIKENSSQVLQEWIKMAQEWINNDDGDYILNGFKGFYQRTTNNIILDFHINDKLNTPLTQEEIEQYLNEE